MTACAPIPVEDVPEGTPESAVLFRPFPGFQERALRASADEVFLGGAKGPGKGLDLQTPIPTPEGWVLMRDLQVGDLVYDERGVACAVLAVSEPTRRPCYRVRFDDGSVLIADDVHRWKVLLQYARARQARKTAEFRAQRRETRPSRSPSSTRPWLAERNKRIAAARREHEVDAAPWDGAEMVDTSDLARYLATDPFTMPAIPCTQPLVGRETDLLIDPYVLGAWLGDGSSAGAGITCDYRWPHVIEQLRCRGVVVRKYKAKHGYGMIGVLVLLRRIGVLNNKHIPPQYLRATVEQRRALLAGLMDTDGSVDVDGAAEISTVSPILADGYHELVTSLGYKTSIRTKMARCQTGAVSRVFRLSWSASDTPVTDPRKAQRLLRISVRSRRRFVVAVEPIGERVTQCISVDSPSRLYLAGTSMIPTHNSAILIAAPLRWSHKPLFAGAFLRESYKELQRPLDEAHRLYSRLPASKRPAWSGEKQRFTWPSGGFLRFGYARTTADITWTQGGNWSNFYYDELGNQPDERVVDTLISEMRCKDPTIHRQFMGSGNPGFAGHPWVKRRYIVPCGKDGSRIAWSRETLPDGRQVWISRQFVPGKVTDNPILFNDAKYMAILAALPERMRRCLMDGDWDAASGVALDELDPNVHLVPAFEPPAHWPYIAAFDWGFAHWAVFMWGRVSDDGRVYVCDTIKRRRLRDWDLAGTFLELVPPEALQVVHAGHDCWNVTKAHGENAPQVAEYFAQQGIHLTQANTARVQGFNNMLQYFAWQATEFLPQRQPMIQFFDTPTNRWLVEEHLPSMVMDPDDPRDVLKVDADNDTGVGGDDAFECLRYLLASRPMQAPSFAHLAQRTSIWHPDVLRREAAKFGLVDTRTKKGKRSRRRR